MGERLSLEQVAETISYEHEASDVAEMQSIRTAVEKVVNITGTPEQASSINNGNSK